MINLLDTQHIMTLTKELPVTGGFFVALEGSETHG